MLFLVIFPQAFPHTGVSVVQKETIIPVRLKGLPVTGYRTKENSKTLLMAVCEDWVRKPGGSLQASVSLIGSLLALIFSCRFYSYFSQTVREIELSDKDTFVLFFNKVAPSLFPHIPALFFTR